MQHGHDASQIQLYSCTEDKRKKKVDAMERSKEYNSDVNCAFILKINKKSQKKVCGSSWHKTWGPRGCWPAPEHRIDPSAGKRSPPNEGAGKSRDIWSESWRVFHLRGEGIPSIAR